MQNAALLTIVKLTQRIPNTVDCRTKVSSTIWMNSLRWHLMQASGGQKMANVSSLFPTLPSSSRAHSYIQRSRDHWPHLPWLLIQPRVTASGCVQRPTPTDGCFDCRDERLHQDPKLMHGTAVTLSNPKFVQGVRKVLINDPSRILYLSCPRAASANHSRPRSPALPKCRRTASRQA